MEIQFWSPRDPPEIPTAGQRRWRRVHFGRPARRRRLGARGLGGAGRAGGEPGAVATRGNGGWLRDILQVTILVAMKQCK